MRHLFGDRAQSRTDPGELPSTGYLELASMSMAQLEKVFVAGDTPDPNALAGWEFRGVNTPPWARLAGIKKFIKGFYRPPGPPEALYGYNCPVVQNRLARAWIDKGQKNVPGDDRIKRFGFYQVYPVDPTARDNAYLHALMLDYSRGGNRPLDPTNGLRDYLVQVAPTGAESGALYLGKAFYALGPARVPVGFFVLERLRRGPEQPRP